ATGDVLGQVVQVRAATRLLVRAGRVLRLLDELVQLALVLLRVQEPGLVCQVRTPGHADQDVAGLPVDQARLVLDAVDERRRAGVALRPAAAFGNDERPAPAVTRHGQVRVQRLCLLRDLHQVQGHAATSRSFSYSSEGIGARYRRIVPSSRISGSISSSSSSSRPKCLMPTSTRLMTAGS